MPEKSKDITYLDKQLKILRWDKHGDLLRKVSEVGGEVYNKFNPWTPLKLCGLSYFAGGYAQILKKLKMLYKNKYSSNFEVVYIDLFSGCGINQIEDTFMAGSPLVCIDSVTNRKVEFDVMFFNDLNSEYCSALEKRLDFLKEKEPFNWISDRYTILNKDCNDALEEIVDNLNKIKNKNFLAFIDPYSLELSWSSMEKLLSIPFGDVIITFQARYAARAVGQYLSSKSHSSGQGIKQFLGEENEATLATLNTEKAIKNYYVHKISEHRKFIADIEVKGGESIPYTYHIIFATRKENPPWAGYITQMKRLIESFSGDRVTASLNYITGKTSRIEDYSSSKEK